MRAALRRVWVASAPYRLLIGILLLLLCLAIYVWRQHDEISESIEAVRSADPAWVSAGMLIQLVAIGTLSLSYVAVMRLLGYRLTWRRLTRLHLRRMAVATVTPAGSATSIYVFIKSVESDDVPASDALLTIALRGACGYAAFVLLLPVAIFAQEQSRPIQIAALALIAILGLIVIVIRGLLGGEQMPGWFERRMPQRVIAFVEEARRHHIHVRGMLMPAAASLASKTASVAVVYCSLLAVGYDPTISTALVGYVVANLSQAVAPVFGGFGVVELTMALALEQLGVPTPQAIAAALIFRLCDLWFQLALGLVAQIDWGGAVRRIASQAGRANSR
jgi:uncharacterized protein (TIRG00374 family)